jgi:hypothetical protein
VLSVQFCSVAFSLMLSLISTRFAATVVPSRDYRVFMGELEELGSRNQ